LNPVLKDNTLIAKRTGPAASRILNQLEPYRVGIRTGRINLKLSGLLMKELKETGKSGYTQLDKLDFNKGYPLERLFKGEYETLVQQQKIVLHLRFARGTVRQQNSLATDYYFEAVLIAGDPCGDRMLETVSQTSALYAFAEAAPESVQLALPLPAGNPWMVLLKVNCLEGKEIAAHPQHYALKVVKTG
jgi:hypothetical protein